MDSVRFGKALGFGARQAAKALMTAADAATSPSPSTIPPKPQERRTPEAPRTGGALGQRAARTTAQVRQRKEGLARGSKRFGEAVWGPFVKLSGVLWLELTGVFFGLFVITALLNAWRLHTNIHDTGKNHDAHMHLLFSLAMAAVFGYFCVSSFVRAGRKQRRTS